MTAGGEQAGHPFRGNQWTEISGFDAKKLLKPSEKPGSHDPGKFIKDTDKFKVGMVALSEITKNESGEAYDSTVNVDRAKDYAARKGSFPPILIGEKRSSGFHNIHDGGHRATAARLRGDSHIAALIKIRSAESNLLSAVRAERLARRVEAVRAAADSKTVVKVILQDEAGRVLVLTDSASGWDDLPGGHVQRGEDPVAGLVREVYEETGIRLVASDVQLYREQPIPKPHGGRMLLYKARVDAAKVKISEEHSGAAWVKRDQLGQRNLGRYAKDVEEASKPDSKASHSAARAKAQAEHKRAATQALGLAAHAVADGQTAHPDGKAKIVGGMLAFMALGAAAAYLAAHRELADGEGTPAVEQEPEAEVHADSRTPLLTGAAEDAVAELEAEKVAVEQAQVARGTVVEGELSKRLAKKARELEGARWERIADTEATATYGAAALRVLDLAGFATVRWSQLDRPTKRHTHKLNQEQGEQPLGFVFSNGQAFPGDPSRGPEENINCACQLIGVRRKAEKVGASEQAGHPFHGNQWEEVAGQASRFRPKEKIHFPKPLHGPSGAKLVAYEWMFKPEEYIDKQGEERIRRVSDWENAEDSSETGRGLVHQFHIEMPSGEQRLVSSETVPKTLGYFGEEHSPAKAKSVMSAVKTLAKLKMKLAVVESKLAHNEEVLQQVAKLQFPADKIVSKKAWSDPNSKSQRFYLSDEDSVHQVQSEEGAATEYTLRNLQDSWKSNRAKELGFIHVYESVRDLKNRIARQEKKIDQSMEVAP